MGSRTVGETPVACSELDEGAVPISYGSYRCDQRRQVDRKAGETVKAERRNDGELSKRATLHKPCCGQSLEGSKTGHP